jgi:GNAT superfamily N-acetyltransferase
VTVTFRLAAEQDLDPAMELVARCIADMRQARIDQWDEVYPDRATVLQDIRAGTMYVAALDADPFVGILVINEVQSAEYGDVPWTVAASPVAVVHRLMIEPRHQGRGLARRMMTFAEQRAREMGYAAIRLDAYSGNPRALRLYQALGYRDAGAIRFRKGVFRCYEKSLGVAHRNSMERT